VKSPRVGPGQTHPGTRHYARTALGILVALLLLMGTTECALRFGLGLGNPVLITKDAACAYTLKPDQDVVRFFALTHINHFGMRSNEVPATHETGGLRLMFVGDSITYGTTRVDQQQIFTELLHHDLPRILHRPVEVLNASAGGWAPENELAFLESRGIFQSDIVLLVLNDGDLTQPPSTIAAVGDDLPQTRPATAIGELYSRYLKPRFQHALGKSDAGDSIVPDSSTIIRGNLKNLDTINTLVVSHGARLIIVFIPFRKDIPDASSMSEAALETWSDSRGVSRFDLTSAEMPYSSKEISLDDGTHFNAKGNNVIAQAIERDWPRVVGNR
jgi:hypothetical protein